jgi:Rieske Fe-S protein
LINTDLETGKTFSRRAFLRFSVFTVTAGFIVLWQMLTSRQKQLSEEPVINRINEAKLGTGIFLFDKFIIVKSPMGLKVFSNRCTHAGCRINRETDGQLICPCHGSKYDAATGKVLQGPAGLSLPQIPFSTDVKTGEIIVKI